MKDRTIIKHDGEPWRVVTMGAERDGKTYCHLASTLHGSWARNGFHPKQIADWIPNEILADVKEAQRWH